MGGKSSSITLVISWVLMAVGLYFWFREMDVWANRAFANPLMGSALIGVLQVLAAVLALCLASPLSRFLDALLDRKRTNAKSPE